jgi:hypothetical protein
VNIITGHPHRVCLSSRLVRACWLPVFTTTAPPISSPSGSSYTCTILWPSTCLRLWNNTHCVPTATTILTFSLTFGGEQEGIQYPCAISPPHMALCRVWLSSGNRFTGIANIVRLRMEWLLFVYMSAGLVKTHTFAHCVSCTYLRTSLYVMTLNSVNPRPF